MPKTEIERIETYNAITGEISVQEIEVQVPTEEELIAEKHDQLIQIYNELQALIAAGSTQSNP